jgi:Leucine-rich repeat (LRR) protein
MLWIENVPNLKILDISSNRLTKISKLENLPHPQLRELNLQENSIDKLNLTKSFKNLRKININSNRITTITVENISGEPISDFDGYLLEELYANNNKIDKWDKSWEKLVNLSKLDLSYNSLNTDGDGKVGLPDLSKAKKLIYIKLDNNKIGSIEALIRMILPRNENKSINQCDNLSDGQSYVKLILFKNSIKTVDLSCLRKLKNAVVYLEGSQLNQKDRENLLNFIKVNENIKVIFQEINKDNYIDTQTSDNQ